MKKSQTKYDILTAAKCGIEFELYSEKSGSQICKDLGKLLNKKIVIPIVSVAFDKEEKGKYHSEMEPTATTFKLEKDFSGGKDMSELITGPLPYEEARLIIIKTLDWIRSNGWTDKKCSIHLNLSFNPFLVKLNNEIMQLDTLKFILSYDENFIYDRFPERKDSVYARSINQIIPINKFSFMNNYDSIDRNNYTLPDEKYYGVNFTKKPKNYLEFRYVGGKDYEYKTQKILEILDYSILKIYNALQTPSYTSEEAAKLKKMMEYQKLVSESFSSPARFLIDFPKIYVFVDMRGSIDIITTYWTSIREFLFSAIISGGMREGVYNYDTDMSISQLRYAKLRNAHEISNFEMFDCDVEGSFHDVDFFRCKIINSRLNQCKLIELNEVYDSKVEHTSSRVQNRLYNCYINSPKEIIEGTLEGGVIRNAIIGKEAIISKRTLIVDSSAPEDAKNNFSSNDKK